MSRASRGKHERFVAHLEPLRAALTAFCRRALRDPDETSDALQSAVANAFVKFDLYSEGTNFKAWMFRYVSHETLNRNRAWARRRTVEFSVEECEADAAVRPEEADLARLLEEPEIVLEHCDEAIARAVLDMPELERSIFLLRALGEFKYREIADILDVPVGTVMGLLSRGRNRLRHSLTEHATSHGLLARRPSAT